MIIDEDGINGLGEVGKIEFWFGYRPFCNVCLFICILLLIKTI
jgi:hypothetical protein